MIIVAKPMHGVIVIEPEVFGDARGFFAETYHEERYREHDVLEAFVQDNHSHSRKGVLRGLHYTVRNPQAQILTVMQGWIFDVVVDLRPKSQTFGQWFGTELSDAGPRQIYMSHGFAHGFCVLSESADLHYKVSRHYDPNDEGGLRWDDPTVGIKWPVHAPAVSERDSAHPLWEEAVAQLQI